MTDTHSVWAVITQTQRQTSRRVMARLAPGLDWDTAVSTWDLADRRRRQGRDEISLSQADGYGTQKLDYLVVRSDSDPVWPRRYPVVPAGRWSALLTVLGSRVRVRIYGNTYTGTVTSIRRLSANVTFRTVTDPTPRTNSFPILPRSRFDRGIQSIANFRG